MYQNPGNEPDLDPMSINLNNHANNSRNNNRGNNINRNHGNNLNQGLIFNSSDNLHNSNNNIMSNGRNIQTFVKTDIQNNTNRHNNNNDQNLKQKQQSYANHSTQKQDEINSDQTQPETNYNNQNQPDFNHKKPNTNGKKFDPDYKKTGTDHKKPYKSDYKKTGTDYKKPYKSDYKKPDTDYKKPEQLDYKKPNTDYRKPDTDYKKPNTNYNKFDPDYRKPDESDSTKPHNSDYKRPDTSDKKPDTDDKKPHKSVYKKPDTDGNKPGADNRKLARDSTKADTDHEKNDKSDYKKPDTDYKKPNTNYKKSDADHGKPATHYTNPDTDSKKTEKSAYKKFDTDYNNADTNYNSQPQHNTNNSKTSDFNHNPKRPDTINSNNNPDINHTNQNENTVDQTQHVINFESTTTGNATLDKTVNYTNRSVLTFLQSLNALKILLFLEVTPAPLKMVVSNTFTLSVKIDKTIKGFLMSYLQAAEASQSGLVSNFETKLLSISGMLNHFSQDIATILNIINPSLASIATEYLIESYNCYSNINNHISLDLDEQSLLNKINQLFIEPVPSGSSTTTSTAGKLKSGVDNSMGQVIGSKKLTKKQKKAQNKAAGEHRRLTLDNLRELTTYEGRSNDNKSNNGVGSVPGSQKTNVSLGPTYSSTICDSISTWISVVSAYFDAVAFLYTAPIKAFVLLNVIFKQKSSYGITNTANKSQLAETTPPGGVDDGGDSENCGDGDTDSDLQFAIELSLMEAESNQSWEAVFDQKNPNPVEQQQNTSKQHLNIQDLIQTRLTNTVSKTTCGGQKTSVGHCHLEIKALYVLLALGRLLMDASKQRLVLSSSTGSGKSVFLPLVQVLLSYYDTTSIYYGLTTSVPHVTLPSDYLSFPTNVPPLPFQTWQQISPPFKPSDQCPLEGLVINRGYCLASDITTLTDAKWTISVIIKHTINQSPRLGAVRDLFRQNNNHPLDIVVPTELKYLIHNIFAESFDLPIDLPFIFLLLPSIAIVREKKDYFTSRFPSNVLNVQLITNQSQIKGFGKLYEQICTGTNVVSNPTLILSTPSAFLNLTNTFFDFAQVLRDDTISTPPTQYLYHSHHSPSFMPDYLPMYKIGILNSCRVILDEAHERSVELDVTLAQIAKMQSLNDQRSFQSSGILTTTTTTKNGSTIKHFHHQQMFTIMSATPDPDQNMTLSPPHTFQLPITARLLYPVTPKVIVSNDANEINNKLASLEASDMINDVLTAKTWSASQRAKSPNTNHHVPGGDCLIFMSGQKECENVVKSVCDNLIKRNDSNNYRIPRYVVIKTTIDADTPSATSFYNSLLAEIWTVTNKSGAQFPPTFLLPLCMLGKSSYVTKEVVCNPLPTDGKYRIFRSVCKIIAATNSVESSVTIDGLTMLVDSGLHKESIFDIQKGISTLSQRSITEDSRTQRKGRVGRTQSAAMVQIKFQPTLSNDGAGATTRSDAHALPALLSSDPSRSLLELRTKGILLEQINSILPSPLSNDDLQFVLTHLQQLKLITNTGLTPLGRRAANIQTISPLYAVSIIQAYDSDPQFGLFTILVIIAMAQFSGNALYFDPRGDFFYNLITSHQSDLVTHVTALLALLGTRGQPGFATQFGVAEKILQQSSATFMGLATSLGYSAPQQGNQQQFGQEPPRMTFALMAAAVQGVCSWVGPRAFDQQTLDSLATNFQSYPSMTQLTKSMAKNLPKPSDIHSKVDLVLNNINVIAGSGWIESKRFDFSKKLPFYGSYSPTNQEKGQKSMNHRFYLPTYLPPHQMTFPAAVVFLNKSVNASLADPFAICSTYHSFRPEQIKLNLSNIFFKSRDPTLYYDHLVYQIQNPLPNPVDHSIKVNLFAPEIYTIQLHNSFFTSPFAELLLDVLLGPHHSFPKQKSYEIEARARMPINTTRGIKSKPKKVFVKKETQNEEIAQDLTIAVTIYSSSTHPRTYVEIASILNRVRALTPLFTNSIMLSRRDNLIVEFVNNVGTLGSSCPTAQQPLDPDVKRIFSPSSDPDIIQAWDKTGFLNPKPFFYPINAGTIAHHEAQFMSDQPASFYPTVIIPSSPDLDFFGLTSTRSSVKLTQANTALPFSFPPKQIDLLSGNIQIVYVSEDKLPNTPELHFSKSEAGDLLSQYYSHSKIPSIISISDNNPIFWIYQPPTLVDNNGNSVDNVWRFLEQKALEITQNLTMAFGHDFADPVQPNPFLGNSLQFLPNPVVATVKDPTFDNNKTLKFAQRSRIQTFEFHKGLSPTIKAHWNDHLAQNYYASSFLKDNSYILLSAQKLHTASHNAPSLPHPPDLNTYFRQKDQPPELASRISPIQPTSNQIQLTILRKGDITPEDFKQKLTNICTTLFPLVFDYRILSDSTKAWVTLLSGKYIYHFIAIFARGFNLSLQDSKSVGTTTTAPININFDPAFTQIEQELHTGEAVPKPTEEQIRDFFTQSVQCRRLYQSITDTFFTPVKPIQSASLWKKRFLTNLTPIFISLQNIPVYLTSTPMATLEQFGEVIAYGGLEQHALESGAIYAKVSSISDLFQLYRNVPTAFDVVQAQLLDPSVRVGTVSGTVVSNDHLIHLSTFIRPLISSSLCLLPSDVAEPIIFSNICLVVFVRHPSDHFKTIGPSFQTTPSLSIQQRIAASPQKVNSIHTANHNFEVVFGPATDGLSIMAFERPDDFYEGRFNYADHLICNLDSVIFPGTVDNDDSFNFSTQVHTRLFEATTAIRYFTFDEADIMGLTARKGIGNSDDDGDLDDDDVEDDDDVDENADIASATLSFKTKIRENIFYNPENPSNLQYFQIVQHRKPFIEWFHESISHNSNTTTELSQSTQTDKGAYHQSLMKSYAITPIPEDKLWITDSDGFLDIITMHGRGQQLRIMQATNNIVSQADHISIANNLRYHGSRWLQDKVKAQSIAFCPPHTLALLRQETRRRPEYGLSFLPVDKDTTFVVFDPHYNNDLVKILNQPPKTTKYDTDLAKNHTLAAALNYRSLGQMGLSESLPLLLRHHGPDKIDQQLYIAQNSIHQALPQRLSSPLPFRSDANPGVEEEDKEVHAYFCCCEAPSLLNIPVYTQIANKQSWIYTGLLPPNLQSDNQIHTISAVSPSLSTMYHTPFSLHPGASLCTQCFADAFEAQINLFATISGNATTVSLEQPKSQTIVNFANLFIPFVYESNQSVWTHFPFGSIILSIFNEARLYYQWQSQGSNFNTHHHQQGKQQQVVKLNPVLTQASISLQLYLSFMVQRAISQKISLLHCPQHTDTIIWPWEDLRVGRGTGPAKRCNHFDPTTNSQCQFTQCPNCFEMSPLNKCKCMGLGRQNEALAQAFNITTPCCQALYVFDGCCAVYCQCQKKLNFCAFCHYSTKEDVHPHVKNCIYNPNNGNYFCSSGALLLIQKKNIVRAQLLAYFRTFPREQREIRYQEAEKFISESLRANYNLVLNDILQ